MRNVFSRRDFLKASAAAVLAASAAGVLTGCDGGGSEIPSATIGLGEFEVTVAADMVLTGDEVVGDENAKSYLCKPNVRIKYNGSGLVGDAFIKVFQERAGAPEQGRRSGENRRCVQQNRRAAVQGIGQRLRDL